MAHCEKHDMAKRGELDELAEYIRALIVNG